MVQAASELLSSLGEGQESIAVARRVPVALGIVVLIVLTSLASVLTTLALG
jgi:hypothetical protein